MRYLIFQPFEKLKLKRVMEVWATKNFIKDKSYNWSHRTQKSTIIKLFFWSNWPKTMCFFYDILCSPNFLVELHSPRWCSRRKKKERKKEKRVIEVSKSSIRKLKNTPLNGQEFFFLERNWKSSKRPILQIIFKKLYSG